VTYSDLPLGKHRPRAIPLTNGEGGRILILEIQVGILIVKINTYNVSNTKIPVLVFETLKILIFKGEIPLFP